MTRARHDETRFAPRSLGRRRPRLQQLGQHGWQVVLQLEQLGAFNQLGGGLGRSHGRSIVVATRIAPHSRPGLHDHHRFLIAQQILVIWHFLAGDVRRDQARDSMRRGALTEHRSREQRVEARLPQHRLGPACGHARERPRVLEEMDDALVIEMAGEKPREPLDFPGVREPAPAPLGRRPVGRVGQGTDHVVL